MVELGYMAHQEQYSPSELLQYAELAAEHGFSFVWTSDHFHPWFHSDAEAGFAWSWLGAAVERVDVPLGTCVTPAGKHYHPALIAQAFATLQEIHDEGIVLGLSTGEAMNEKPLGHEWPAYGVRRDRLEETLEIVHLLWGEEGFVSYDGDHFGVDDARLYTMPERRPKIHIAANGPSTASLTGEYGDGFVTVKKGEKFSEQLHPAIQKYASEAGRDPDAIENTLLVIASYDPDYEAAFESTRPWWATTQDIFDRAIANPEKIEEEGANTTEEQVEEKFLITDDPADLAAQLEDYAELGFDRVLLGNTSPNPEQFLEVVGDEVVPAL